MQTLQTSTLSSIFTEFLLCMQLSTYKIQNDGVFYLSKKLSDNLIDMLANVRYMTYVLIKIPTLSNHMRREIVSTFHSSLGKSGLSLAPL